jgi:hypothetical protein
MWLLRLPRLRNTLNCVESRSAVISFVLVLPALPVIATTLAPDRRRTSSASDWSAVSVSRTRITAGGSAASDVIEAAGRASSSASRPAAPRRAASSRNA